ncbi:hypothetical protein SAMN05192539_10792 [Paraburkholderia diazotrophica]|uniref:Uncharacterized protein n=1 Tax=Paraburkholderia diazotrophica TaxID=667676 RepID=A0A1H7EIY7_9BURK|nr:hypothetical protein SAMN05192539_10792 [Paraburkholderia diazotrophica]
MFAPHVSLTERVWFFVLLGLAVMNVAVPDIPGAGDRTAVVFVEHIFDVSHSQMVVTLV